VLAAPLPKKAQFKRFSARPWFGGLRRAAGSCCSRNRPIMSLLSAGANHAKRTTLIL
jgi:hypothetical protein